MVLDAAPSEEVIITVMGAPTQTDDPDADIDGEHQ